MPRPTAAAAGHASRAISISRTISSTSSSWLCSREPSRLSHRVSTPARTPTCTFVPPRSTPIVSVASLIWRPRLVVQSARRRKVAPAPHAGGSSRSAKFVVPKKPRLRFRTLFMADDGEQRPQGAPDYKVYRAKRGIFSRLKGGDVPRSEDADQGAAGGGAGVGGGRPGGPGPGAPDEPGRTNYGRGGGGGGPRLPEFKLPWKGRERRRRGSRRKPPARRIAFWLGIAIVGWIVISFLAFAVSAQLQSFKLSGEAKEALHGNPFILPSAQNILVMGTDA